MPLAAIAAGLVDFAISFVVLLLMMAVYGVAPSLVDAGVAAVPARARSLSAAGAGILFSALIVSYRDVRYVMTFVDAAVAVRHAGAVCARHHPARSGTRCTR